MSDIVILPSNEVLDSLDWAPICENPPECNNSAAWIALDKCECHNSYFCCDECKKDSENDISSMWHCGRCGFEWSGSAASGFNWVSM